MRYLFYLREGLRFSVPVFVVVYFTALFQKYGYNSIDLLVYASTFVLLAGPVWAYAMTRLVRKEDRQNTEHL